MLEDLSAVAAHKRGVAAVDVGDVALERRARGKVGGAQRARERLQPQVDGALVRDQVRLLPEPPRTVDRVARERTQVLVRRHVPLAGGDCLGRQT